MNQSKTDKLRHLLKEEHLPAVIIDLDALDRNAEMLVNIGKPVRLATKSIRVPEILKRVTSRHPEKFSGFMTYSIQETLALAEAGFDNFLLAYPTLQKADLSALQKIVDTGKKFSMVVDSLAQIESLDKNWASSNRLGLVIEVDGSLRLLGGLIHLGVRRSGVRTPAQVLSLIEKMETTQKFKFSGLMVYEAQVAGLTDKNPFKSMLNPIAHIVRTWSQKRVMKLRAEIRSFIQSKGYSIPLFNGGGSGNLNWISQEESLTELAAGSALYCPHLFDYYSNIHFEPACYFALQVTRSSDRGYVTCQGGGYVASGEPGWDRVALPVDPPGLKLVGTEGTGEVQTPLTVPANVSLDPGDVVLFRHAKAGEIMERFNEVLFVQDGRIVERAKTYRGLGIQTY